MDNLAECCTTEVVPAVWGDRQRAAHAENPRDSMSAAALAALRSTTGLNFESMLQHCHAARILPEYLNGKNTEQTRHHLSRLAAYRYAQQHYAVHPLPIPTAGTQLTNDASLRRLISTGTASIGGTWTRLHTSISHCHELSCRTPRSRQPTD
jgi:hypothetical protein